MEKVIEVYEVVTEEEVLETSNLIVHNDDINSFQYVIAKLVEVCKHTREQAAQCAMMVDLKGSCVVKSGPKTEMEEMKDLFDLCKIISSVE